MHNPNDDLPEEPPAPQEGDPGPGLDDMTASGDGAADAGHGGGGSPFEREPRDEVIWSRAGDGRYALYGPAALLQEGTQVEVHRRDGSTSTETVGPPADPGGSPLPEGMAMHANVRSAGQQQGDGGFRREPRDDVIWSRAADGTYALYGPAELLKEDSEVEVHRRDGSTSREMVGAPAESGGSLPEGMAMHAIVRRRR